MTSAKNTEVETEQQIEKGERGADGCQRASRERCVRACWDNAGISCHPIGDKQSGAVR